MFSTKLHVNTEFGAQKVNLCLQSLSLAKDLITGEKADVGEPPVKLEKHYFPLEMALTEATER